MAFDLDEQARPDVLPVGHNFASGVPATHLLFRGALAALPVTDRLPASIAHAKVLVRNLGLFVKRFVVGAGRVSKVLILGGRAPGEADAVVDLAAGVAVVHVKQAAQFGYAGAAQRLMVTRVERKHAD